MSDYTPDSDVDAGDVVVQADLVGIATEQILADELGALAVSGVFDVPKDTGSGAAIPAGTKVYWDDGNQVATATADSNPWLGTAVEAASDDDTEVRVRLAGQA